MHSLAFLIMTQSFPTPRNFHSTCEVIILNARKIKNCAGNKIFFQAAYSDNTGKRKLRSHQLV
jgi:hypothetical protein